jgi:hypothetical protein
MKGDGGSHACIILPHPTPYKRFGIMVASEREGRGKFARYFSLWAARPVALAAGSLDEIHHLLTMVQP